MVKAAGDAASTVVPLSRAVIQSEQGVADAFFRAGLIPVQVKISDFVAAQFAAGT